MKNDYNDKPGEHHQGQSGLPKHGTSGTMKPSETTTTHTMSTAEQWKRIIRLIADQLCLHPEQVTISNGTMNPEAIMVTVATMPESRKLAGGRNEEGKSVYWEMLRDFITITNRRDGTRVSLPNIAKLDPDPARREPYPPFQPRVKWDSRPVVGILEAFCQVLLDYQVQIEVTNGTGMEAMNSRIDVRVSEMESAELVRHMNERLMPLMFGLSKIYGRKDIILKFHHPDAEQELAATTSMPSYDPAKW